MNEIVLDVNTSVIGFHHWPDAPAHKSYLASIHRHTFHFCAYVEVTKLNREIEFHDALADLEKAIKEIQTTRTDAVETTFFGHKSCEMLATDVLEKMSSAISVHVSEDGECGATVDRSSSHPKVLTVCGSTKFKEEYEAALLMLEQRGIAAFSVGGFMHADKLETSREMKKGYDKLHKQKIDISDGIYVVNPDDYIGDSTKAEIIHAAKAGKDIYALNPTAFETGDGLVFLKGIGNSQPVRRDLFEFAEKMETKLAKNDWKGGWKGKSFSDIMGWLQDEMKELEDAIRNGRGYDAVQGEAVDIANVAMMIYERAREWK